VFLGVIKAMVPGLISTFYAMFANIGTDDSVQYRTHDYTTVAGEFAKHPILGRGLGTWYAPKHQVFDNQYLLSLVEVGVLGLVTFVGILLLAVYAALKARSLSVTPLRRDLGLTLAAMLVVPLIGCATFDLSAFHTVSSMTILTAGLSGAFLRITKAERLASEKVSVSGGSKGVLRA
jgi:O-antigen ligase